MLKKIELETITLFNKHAKKSLQEVNTMLMNLQMFNDALEEYKSNQVQAGVKPACETLQKRFDIYAKAINQIDDFFEYQYINHHQDDIKRRVMEIIDNITKQLSKSV